MLKRQYPGNNDFRRKNTRFITFQTPLFYADSVKNSNPVRKRLYEKLNDNQKYQ